MSKNNATPVDPRVRRTRQMLQQAMNELMKEKSFQTINVQDITARADLNRATFYKHYLDKYDLLDTIIRQRLQTMLDERLSAQSALTSANVKILIQTVSEYLSGFHGDCQLSRAHNEQSLMMRQVQHLIYEVLFNWLNDAPVRPLPEQASPEMLALLTSWMIFGPLMQVEWGTHKIAKKEAIQQVVTAVDSTLEEYWV